MSVVLPAPWPQEAEELSLLDLQADIIERGNRAEALGDPLDLDGRNHSSRDG